MPTSEEIWHFPVHRSDGDVSAIQELADAKSLAMGITTKADQILAALEKVSSPQPAVIDYAALAKAVNDDAAKRLAE